MFATGIRRFSVPFDAHVNDLDFPREAMSWRIPHMEKGLIDSRIR